MSGRINIMGVYSRTEEPETMSVARENDAADARLKVLIIDDEPVDREIFKQYLDGGGPDRYLFAEASTGRDGLRRMEAFNPDCILLDFNLPDLDGLRMIRMLHDGRDFLPCAVVMLTGTGNEEVAVEAMKLGVMDYMAKGPASAYALSRTVASAVQRFRFQQEIARQRTALEQRNRELEAIRAELFDEKERYRVLAEAIPQLVWTADSGGRIHYGNRRLWDFNGDASNPLGLLENLVHPEDRAGFRHKWDDAVRSGGAFESELRLQHARDQTWRRHLMRTVPISGTIPATGGGAVRWFGTFTDIEDQKRAEEALRRREKLDSIGLLAGGVAHDFNNLLAGVMGGASFAIDSLEPDHPAVPTLEIILRASERGAILTQQLLAYAGQAQLFLEPADIRAIVRHACDSVRASIPGNIQLTVDAADDIPLMETNTGYMQQIVVNLVKNAVEAIAEKPGAVTVKAACKKVTPSEPQWNVLEYELPPGQYVSIEVSDSGPGMDDRTQGQIFDPFFTTKFTGRGLGLAVVQGIVRSLRGGIRVYTAPGLGSAFSVLLPLREPAGNTATHQMGADGTAA